MAQRFVDVLLPVALDQTYSYRVPDGMALAPGDVVDVPLGARTATGAVWAGDVAIKPGLHNRMKDVEEKLDIPPLRPELRRFVDWVSGYTLSPRGMVLRMALRVMSPTSENTSMLFLALVAAGTAVAAHMGGSAPLAALLGGMLLKQLNPRPWAWPRQLGNASSLLTMLMFVLVSTVAAQADWSAPVAGVVLALIAVRLLAKATGVALGNVGSGNQSAASVVPGSDMYQGIITALGPNSYNLQSIHRQTFQASSVSSSRSFSFGPQAIRLSKMERMLRIGTCSPSRRRSTSAMRCRGMIFCTSATRPG